MAMTSLKNTPSDDTMLAPYSPDNYPCGLSLYLNDEVCEKLGLSKALRAGSEVTISARAIVVSATESLDRDNDGGNDVSLQLQITDMSAKAGGVVRNAAQALYGDGD